MEPLTNNSRVYPSLIVFFIVVAVCGSATAQVQVPRIAALPARNQQMVPKPRVLTQIQKIQVAQKILSGTGQKVSSLESPMVLDLFHLIVKERAFLSFNSTNLIDSNSNIVYLPPGNQSYVQAGFVGLLPGTYLIDFSVSSTDTSSNFTVRTPSGVDMKMLNGLANQHLFSVAIVKPGDVNPISVIVNASHFWYFHSCEISRVN